VPLSSTAIATNKKPSVAEKQLPQCSAAQDSTTNTALANSENGLIADKYYLDNFNYLIDFVRQHYAHLFTTEAHQFCQSYNCLTENGQQLFVRLVLRTHASLRLSKINYADITTTDGLEELQSHGFVELNTDCIEHCLHLFTHRELSSALGCPYTNATDIDLIAWTTPDLFGDSPAAKLMANETIVEVNFRELVVTFRLLFFGNLHQDFSSFVLRDLGYQRFENYTIDNKTLLFKSQEQIEAHLRYYDCADRFDDACLRGSEALQELSHSLPVKIPSDKTLCRRLDRLNNRIARQLERENELDSAAHIYATTMHPPSRERLARIKEKQGNTIEALAICRQIMTTHRDCDELDFASQFGQRIAKKSGLKFPTSVAYKPPETKLTLEKSNLSVEFSAALQLAKSGKCYYLENNLLSGMFGLAFWDIIFAPVNGAFFHPFQSHPADFYEPEFALTRKSLIEDRLTEISNGKLSHYINSCCYHKRSIRNPLVNWALCRKHILDLALKQIPAAHWHAVFRQLLSDVRNFRSGQPDLVYFPDEGGYQLLEVKAPGDKLQKNQLRWMKFFKEHNMPHGVLHVEWLDE